MTCVDFRSLFFNDLSDEDAKHWISTLQPGPACWNGQATTYCGWREVPSAYIMCEKDRTIHLAYQEKMAELAGSKPIVRLATGHMPQLTVPEKIAEIVNQFASEAI
jgi:pimeloyl-ACP methyl ester carboxylesterase